MSIERGEVRAIALTARAATSNLNGDRFAANCDLAVLAKDQFHHGTTPLAHEDDSGGSGGWGGDAAGGFGCNSGDSVESEESVDVAAGGGDCSN